MRLLTFTKGRDNLQRAAWWIAGFLTLISLGMFAYLGTFTRYLADDYCEAVSATHGSVFTALVQRYMTSSDRYSNLLFVSLSELVLPHNVQAVPVVMVTVWTAALIWLVWELKKLAGLRWPFPVDVLLGALLAFFPIFEAPNRFQTIYWRSGMATHFAPLVYLTLLMALLLRSVRRGEGRKPAIWLGVLFFVLAFFGGGFSEPPVAMLVAGSLLALVALLIWEKGPRRSSATSLVAWTLGGALTALAVLKFSPANAFRLGTPPPGLLLLIYRTILYSFQFIADSLVTLPLPTLVSIVLPAVVFYGLLACSPALASAQRRNLLLVAAVTPVLMYGLIAASFAPSVYGQAYPVERARFAGRLMMTTAALIEGACLGTFLAQWRAIRSQALLVNLSCLVFVVLAFYPVRAAVDVLNANLAYTKEWAAAWDARQAVIYADIAQGQQDLVVPQLPGFEHIKELDTRSHLWVNRCASQFYGVQSISAPQMESLP